MLKARQAARTVSNNEVLADRVVDSVVVASGATVLLQQVEHAALIFSLVAGGVYYSIKAYNAWKNGNGHD